VVVKYLQGSYLWEKVRVQGGAYGGSCNFDRRSGGFTFGSYRDPNLLATLDVFDRAAGFLTGEKVSESEVTRSIIGVIGDLDGHMLPDAKGYASLLRYLVGDTDEVLQRLREEVLATRAEAFSELGEALKQVAREGRVVVLGSEPAIGAANTERPGFLAVTKVL
jgi:Zn-dependent M16 (insulinase) family peptidase